MPTKKKPIAVEAPKPDVRHIQRSVKVTVGTDGAVTIETDRRETDY